MRMRSLALLAFLVPAVAAAGGASQSATLRDVKITVTSTGSQSGVARFHLVAQNDGAADRRARAELRLTTKDGGAAGTCTLELTLAPKQTTTQDVGCAEDKPSSDYLLVLREVQ